MAFSSDACPGRTPVRNRADQRVAAILMPDFSRTVTKTEPDPRALEKPIISRLAVALVLALAATAANAQDGKSGPSQTPPAPGVDGTRPFLFEGRMKNDGVRREASTDDRHPSAGAIVMPPKTGNPAREQ